MTWYDTYEEIKTKYPDTVFEEYWLTKDDADKLKRYEPIKKGWVTIENNPDTSGLLYLVTNVLSMALKQKRMMGMSEAYCCILEYCLLLMMIQ